MFRRVSPQREDALPKGKDVPSQSSEFAHPDIVKGPQISGVHRSAIVVLDGLLATLMLLLFALPVLTLASITS